MKSIVSRSARALIITMMAGILLTACGEKSPENILVKVDDSVITLDDFQREWLRQLPVSQGLPQESVDRFIGDMIAEKLFIIEARRRKIDQDEKFKAEVEKYREQLMVEALLNQEVLAVGKPTEAEVVAYWEKNRGSFEVPELVRFSHILVRIEEDENEEAVLARCKKIKEQLDGGGDFADVAREFSEGSSAGRSGDLGYYRPSQISPEFKAAAEELKGGEISEPIHTDYGYHLIKVTDRKSARQKTLDESREEIITIILAGKRKSKFDTVKARLESESTIWKNMDLIDRLRAERQKMLNQDR